MNKIFVIGFPKSGTTSIHASLTTHNISVIHWGDDPINPKVIVGLKIREAKNQNKKLLSYLDEYQAFTQMETCIDKNRCYWPQLVDVPLLKEQYPNSKFIFNDRIIEKWIGSLQKWNIVCGPFREKGESLIERMIRLDIPGLPAGKGKNEEELKQWYIAHKNNMIDFFKHDDNFIVFNIETDHGQKLGDFLEIKDFIWQHHHKSYPRNTL
jgi:hypothetical protein